MSSDHFDDPDASDPDDDSSGFLEPSPWDALEVDRERTRHREVWLEPTAWDVFNGDRDPEAERQAAEARRASIARWAAIIADMRAAGKIQFAGGVDAVERYATTIHTVAEAAQRVVDAIRTVAAGIGQVMRGLIESDHCRRRRVWRIRRLAGRRGRRK